MKCALNKLRNYASKKPNVYYVITQEIPFKLHHANKSRGKFAFSLHPDRITKILELLESNDKNYVRYEDI